MDILHPRGPMTTMTPGFHTWVQAILAMVDSSLAAGELLHHRTGAWTICQVIQHQVQTQPFKYRGFHSHGGTPLAGWFGLENPIKVDELGVTPYFRKHPISSNGQNPTPRRSPTQCEGGSCPDNWNYNLATGVTKHLACNWESAFMSKSIC